MTEKLITTDPPGISIGDFEDLLVTDKIFVNFFNRFLQLPTFPEPLRFNSQNGEFEVISNDKEQIAEKIKNLHRSRNPVGEIYKNAVYKQPIKLPHYEREELERRSKENIEIKTTFRVKCLDKEQGIEWMKRHRLPVFLQSELYNEYRLCRLLAQIEAPQQDIRFKVDRNCRPWVNENGKKSQKQQRKDNRRAASSKYSSSARSDGKTNKLTNRPFTPTTGRSFTPSSFDSCRPKSVQQQRQEIGDDSNMRYLRHHSYKDETQSDTSTSEEMSCFSSVKSSSSGRNSPKYFIPTAQSMNVVRIEPISTDDEEDDEKSDVLCDVTNKDKPVDVEGFVDEMVESAIKFAYGSMRTSSSNQQLSGDSSSAENKTESISNEKDPSPKEREISPTNNSTPISLTKVGGGTSNLSKKWLENTGQGEIDDEDEDETNSVFSDIDDEVEENENKNKLDFKGIKGFDKFRQFIKGTNGEKIFHLWLDIDQSRFMLNSQQTSSYLQRLREVYLNGGGMMQLSLDFLKQHSLHHTSEWKVETLQMKQTNLVQPLLLYWAPRFMMHQRNGEIPLKATNLQRRVDVLNKSTSQAFPSPKTMTIVPLRPRTCLPHVSRSLNKTAAEDEVQPSNSQKRRCAFVIQNMVSNHPDPIFTQPSTIPNYLIPKVYSIQNILNSDQSTHGRGSQSRKGYQRTEIRRITPLSENQIKLEQLPSTAGNSPFSGKKSTSFGRWEMEEMLQALCHDTRAGLFFTNFCEKSNNMIWMHSIHFWFDIQQYRHLFYDETFDQYLVNKRSKTIYGKYIVYGSPEDIHLSGTIRSMIMKNMNPPFDELFDDAEEHVLKMLIDPWKKMLGKDQDAYSRVELIEQERNLRISAKYLSSIQKKFVVQRKHPSTPGLSYRSQEEDLWSRVPEEYRDTTFEDLVKNRIELEHLRDFMDANFSKIDLMCWLDAETFKRLPHQADEKREQKAKEFKSKYIHKKYFFGPASPASKQEQNEAVIASGGWGKTLKERPPNELIFEVQKYAKRRMENKWLPLFLATEAYQERQKSLSKMSEVAEDIILQKKKKRGEPWRLLDSRWQSSSRDVIEFRRGLSNRVTAGQFRRYVGVKGDLLENDVLFWVEVQKYKDFCHIHNDPAAIDCKITSIINCFLNSQIPPSLQIDIPTEMAEKILEKRKDLGPYIFREAQVTVFRVLFPHWSGFCEFRKTLGDDKLTYTLERQKRKRLLRMRQQAREQEAALQKEEARIKREANSFDFGADLFSLKGSDTAESYFGTELGRERIEPLAWTYGKHMEELERKRLMLMLENEIEGRVPLAADRELDCSTNRSETESGTAVSAKKASSTLASLQVGQIKRRKSVGNLSQSTSCTTYRGRPKGGVRRNQDSVRTTSEHHQPTPPQVTVD